MGRFSQFDRGAAATILGALILATGFSPKMSTGATAQAVNELAWEAQAAPSALPEWLLESSELAEAFGGILFPEMALPERDRIDGVEHRRPDSSQPSETGAVRMILDYHDVPYHEALAEQITVRERYPNEFIRPPDLVHALEGVSVETAFIASWDPYAEDHGEVWKMAYRIIRAAIHLDLPVLVGYRPEMEVETPEYAGVAVGFDRRSIHLLEPFGTRQPVRYDLRDFKFMFAYAMIIFPVFDSEVDRPIEQIPIKTAFLNEISSIILALPDSDPERLAARLRENDFGAVLQDVNRTDYRDRLGKTRQFAREGGIPLVDVLLDTGKVVIIPQEYRRGHVGFALIYGRIGDDFAVVFFSPERTFARRLASRSDLARRWLTRDDRTYRLALIHVPVKSQSP